jgi:hypothetical protein
MSRRFALRRFLTGLGTGLALLTLGPIGAHSQTPRPASPPKQPFYWEARPDDFRPRSVFDSEPNAETLRICKSVRDLRPPAADLPTAAEEKALKDCDSQSFYYGLGGPRDLGKARKCALLELRNDPDPNPGRLLTGAGVLMNIYANGAGVPRNLDLATHMACSIPSAVAEIEGRVGRLQALKTQPGPAEPFDYCDNITSGIAGGECTGVTTTLAAMARDKRLGGVTAAWTPAQRQALANLRVAQRAFSDAHQGEVDASGTGRYAFWIEATEEVDKFSDKLVAQLARGGLPAGDAVSADRALNLAYRKALAEDVEGTTVKPRDIRKAQRAWLKYRDAWIALSLALRPGQPTGAVTAAVTRERARQLRDGPTYD